MRHENSDRKNRNLGSDRKRVAGGQDHEVDYLMQKCHCSREDVLDAIERVGHNRAKLEQFLMDNNNTGRPR